MQTEERKRSGVVAVAWCLLVCQLWLYDEGQITHVGIGHSSAITRVAIAPHEKTIISCSVDGAVFVWSFPTLPPPPVDIMATNPNAIEAAAERHEDEDDRCLVADRPDAELEPAFIEKAGVLLPMSDKCREETRPS